MTLTCPACGTRVPMARSHEGGNPRLACRRCGERLTGTGTLAPLDNDLLMDWLGGASRRDEPYEECASEEDAGTLDATATSQDARTGTLMKNN